MDTASLRIGPNPVQQGESLDISFYNPFRESVQVDLLDATGQTVYSTTVDGGPVVLQTLSTRELQSGTYTLRIYALKSLANRRITIT